MSISDCITLLGVIITGLFSFLVWKATKETADVAKATYKLSEKLALNEENRSNKYRNIMRRQLVPHILKESEKVYNAVADTDASNLYLKLRNNTIETLNISMTDLAEYFSEEEVKLITKAWETYENYRSKYYRNGYNGNGMNILLEKNEPVIMDFYYLIEELKKVKFD